MLAFDDSSEAWGDSEYPAAGQGFKSIVVDAVTAQEKDVPFSSSSSFEIEEGDLRCDDIFEDDIFDDLEPSITSTPQRYFNHIPCAQSEIPIESASSSGGTGVVTSGKRSADEAFGDSNENKRMRMSYGPPPPTIPSSGIMPRPVENKQIIQKANQYLDDKRHALDGKLLSIQKALAMLHNSIRAITERPLPQTTEAEIRTLEFTWSRFFAKKQALLVMPGEETAEKAIPPPPPSVFVAPPPSPPSPLANSIKKDEELEEGDESFTLAPIVFVDTVFEGKPVALATHVDESENAEENRSV